MKLRVGFIGLGAMGLSHVRSIQKLCGDQAQVAALCGTRDANLNAAMTEFPEAKAFKQPEELIASDLDAVFVSTPNFTHVRLAEEILSAGKHLFLEKPCGITREECRRLLDLSRRSDRVLMIGHELRLLAVFPAN